MSLFKGNMDSSNKFTANDDIRALEIIGVDSIPAQLVLQTGESSPASWYLWVDSSDNLRMNEGTAPTSATEGTAGSVVTGASNAGANRTLSNLGTTTINADLLPTTATYDLGSSSAVWAESFVTKTVFYPTDCYITGTSTVATLTGSLVLGSDGDGYDLILYGETAGGKITWDQNAYTNVGALLLTDNVHLGFGAASSTTGDIYFSGDGTNLAIEAATDDVIIISGAASDVDWQWESYATSGQDMGWIADVGTFQLCDDTILAIGGATVLTADDGFTFVFDGTATLNVDAVTAEDSFTIGESVSTDFELHGTAYDILWDASVDDLIYGDSVGVVWGGGADLRLESNGTIVVGTFGATTNSLQLQSYAAQTASTLHIDGDTSDFTGANDVGLVHIDNDSAAQNAGSSLLILDFGGVGTSGAEGTCLRVLDSGTTAAGTSYAAEMYSAANNVVLIHNDAVGDSAVTVAPANNATASAVIVNGNTGGFVGAASTGLVHVSQSGTLADAAASALFIDFNGTYAANTVGGCINVDDDGTAGGTDYSVSVNSLGVNAMKLETQAVTMTALVLEPATNATAAAFIVDGDANGFLGAANVGMVHIKNDIALTDVLSSAVLLDVGATKPIDAAEGYVFRIADTSLVASSNNSYAAYIDATANHGMKIETRATAATNFTLSGVQAQTASLAVIDASTGTGWDGADVTGALHVKTTAAHINTGATNLYVGHATGQVIASAKGYLARFLGTGTARAGAVGVEIAVTDATEVALDVSLGTVDVGDWVQSGGYHYHVQDVKATDAGLALSAKHGFYTCDQTTGDNGDILVLPAGLQGMMIWVYNDDATWDIVIDGNGAETINGGANITLGQLTTAWLVCVADGVWVAQEIAANGALSTGA